MMTRRSEESTRSSWVKSSVRMTQIHRMDLLSRTDSVKFLLVDDDPACFGHGVLDESVRDYGDTDTDEPLGTERCE